MEYVLTETSSVSCDHPVPPEETNGGAVVLEAGQSVLKIDGSYVLAKNLQESLIDSSGCSLSPPPPPTNKKCSLVMIQISGFSSVLKVDGSPVLLTSAGGSTDGLPEPSTWSAKDAEQDVLRAD